MLAKIRFRVVFIFTVELTQALKIKYGGCPTKLSYRAMTPKYKILTFVPKLFISSKKIFLRLKLSTKTCFY